VLAQEKPTEPTAEERRRAVCAAMTRSPGLLRFATRFTGSIEDAEDAYQRAMEIALTRAPVTEHAAFTSWLHTVIRREATAIAERRVRESPAAVETIAEALPAPRSTQPDAVVEWRDRYRQVQDAIHGLTETQRVCVMLVSAGASYPEIEDLTGYSDRQIRRAINEGRSHLYAWEVRMSAGTECARAGELIDLTVDDEASRRQRRTLSRHLRHCAPCRARYRSRRDQTRLLGSLVPPALVGAQVLDVRPPDPGFALQWWERLTASAGAKAAHAMQIVMDAPALATTKAGAGAIAVAAAGAIGAPVVIDSVRADRTQPPVAVVRAQPGAGSTAPRRDRPEARGAGPSNAARSGSPSTALRTAAATRRVRTTTDAAAGSPTHTATRTVRWSAPAAGAASLEFGP